MCDICAYVCVHHVLYIYLFHFYFYFVQISEQVDDVSVTCEEDLFIECEKTNVELQWNFQVDTEVRLKCLTYLLLTAAYLSTR